MLTATFKDVKKHIDNIKKANDKASYRTLNIVSQRAKKEVNKEITENYPVTQASINRANKVDKAKPGRAFVKWNIKQAYRLNVPKPRQLKKGGVTYMKYGKVKVKHTDTVRTGSKPFVIIGQNSKRHLAVYRKPGNKKKVSTIKGHSIPYLFHKAKWNDVVRRVWKREWANEYDKQVKRAGY